MFQGRPCQQQGGFSAHSKALNMSRKDKDSSKIYERLLDPRAITKTALEANDKLFILSRIKNEGKKIIQPTFICHGRTKLLQNQRLAVR